MKKTFLMITGVLVVVAALFVNATDSAVTGYEVGDLARGFSLENVDGNMVSLDDFSQAKGFIVVFTCNTCPYAKAYEQRIIALDRMFKEKGFPVIAIQPNNPEKSPGDSMEEMITRARSKSYPFPYLMDKKQDITMAYGATKTPHVFVLNKEETDLRVEYIGAIDNSPREADDATEKYVEDAVNALLKGDKPAITTKRAIGCGIKWADR